VGSSLAGIERPMYEYGHSFEYTLRLTMNGVISLFYLNLVSAYCLLQRIFLLTTMFCVFGDPETVKFEVPVGKIVAYLLNAKDEIQVLTLSSQKDVIIARLVKHLFVSFQLFTLLSLNSPYSKGMQRQETPCYVHFHNS
jgi:hypothetical protein